MHFVFSGSNHNPTNYAGQGQDRKLFLLLLFCMLLVFSSFLVAFLCCGCLLLRQDQQNDAISISTLYGKGAAKTLRAKCWLGVGEGGLEGGGLGGQFPRNLY